MTICRISMPIIALVVLSSSANAEPRRGFAARAGWAYGIGIELEYRPGSWGVGASGGYVPGLGMGGYVGAQWGMRPLQLSGFVAEAGIFRGVHNPLRVAQTGLGLYALGGYTIGRAERLSVRAVAGGGLPVGDEMHPSRSSFSPS
jgi:hypothetical protein